MHSTTTTTHHTTITTTAALHHATSSSCSGVTTATTATLSENTAPTTFGPSVESLCHPWFKATSLSYMLPIFEASVTASCGTTGIDIVIHSSVERWWLMMNLEPRLWRLVGASVTGPICVCFFLTNIWRSSKGGDLSWFNHQTCGFSLIFDPEIFKGSLSAWIQGLGPIKTSYLRHGDLTIKSWAWSGWSKLRFVFWQSKIGEVYYLIELGKGSF